MLLFREKISAIAGLLTLVLFFQHVSSHSRHKRFLTFPRTSPTRVQLIVGIGIPVDLEIESVTIGWVLKAEYFLPENASNYLNIIADPFDLTTRPIGVYYVRKRREMEEAALLEEPKPTEAPIATDENRDSQPSNVSAYSSSSGYDETLKQKFEHYEVPVVEVESGTDAPPAPPSPEPSPEDDYFDGMPQWNQPDDMSEADYWNQEDKAEWLNDPLRPRQPQNLDISRWVVYKGIATLASSKGLNGRACVLRSICESAHTNFDYSNGILGELMHIVMTPSTTRDELSDHSDNEYMRAEDLGKHGAPCDKIFKECSISILDQFSGIYTPMMNIIKMLG